MLIDELLGYLINVLLVKVSFWALQSNTFLLKFELDILYFTCVACMFIREEFPCNHFVNTCNIEYQFVKKKNYNKPLIYFGMKAFLVDGTFFGLKIKILI